MWYTLHRLRYRRWPHPLLCTLRRHVLIQFCWTNDTQRNVLSLNNNKSHQWNVRSSMISNKFNCYTWWPKNPWNTDLHFKPIDCADTSGNAFGGVERIHNSSYLYNDKMKINTFALILATTPVALNLELNLRVGSVRITSLKGGVLCSRSMLTDCIPHCLSKRIPSQARIRHCDLIRENIPLLSGHASALIQIESSSSWLGLTHITQH